MPSGHCSVYLTDLAHTQGFQNESRYYFHNISPSLIVDIEPGLSLYAQGKRFPNLVYKKEIEGSRLYARYLHSIGLRLLLFPQFRDAGVPAFDGIIFSGDTPVANYSHKSCPVSMVLACVDEAQTKAAKFDQILNTVFNYSPNDRAYLRSIFGALGREPRPLHVVVSTVNGGLGALYDSNPKIYADMQNYYIRHSTANIQTIVISEQTKMRKISSHSIIDWKRRAP